MNARVLESVLYKKKDERFDVRRHTRTHTPNFLLYPECWPIVDHSRGLGSFDGPTASQHEDTRSRVVPGVIFRHACVIVECRTLPTRTRLSLKSRESLTRGRCTYDSAALLHSSCGLGVSTYSSKSASKRL